MDGPFIGLARVETMIRDFNRLRKSIREWDAEEAEKAFEKCERWISCINPNQEEKK